MNINSLTYLYGLILISILVGYGLTCFAVYYVQFFSLFPMNFYSLFLFVFLDKL